MTAPTPQLLAADAITLRFFEDQLEILLIERDNPPFAGQRALPGGFVEPNETVERAALRELEEETGIVASRAEQLAVYSQPGRDPRGRVVSAAHLVLVGPDAEPRAGDDARTARWYPLKSATRLAFDHDEMVALASARLAHRAHSWLFGAELLSPHFSLSQLQRLQERIVGRPFDERNFRRKVLESGVLVALDEWETGVPHRRARLYRFDLRRYRALRNRWHREAFGREEFADGS